MMIRVLPSTMRRLLKESKFQRPVFEGKKYVVVSFGNIPIYCLKDSKDMKVEENGHTRVPLIGFGYPSISTITDKCINREDLTQQATDILNGLTKAEREEVMANLKERS